MSANDAMTTIAQLLATRPAFENDLAAEHQKALLRDWQRYVAWTREFIRKGQGEDVLGMVRQEMADFEDEQDEKRLGETYEKEGGR